MTNRSAGGYRGRAGDSGPARLRAGQPGNGEAAGDGSDGAERDEETVGVRAAAGIVPDEEYENGEKATETQVVRRRDKRQRAHQVM